VFQDRVKLWASVFNLRVVCWKITVTMKIHIRVVPGSNLGDIRYSDGGYLQIHYFQTPTEISL
jgi:hypothetical protein